VYRFLHRYGLDKDVEHNRIDQLLELDENKRKDFDQSVRNQEKG
jgi:hypothetical protein